LVQYGSEEGTLGSIRFPRRNCWFNTVPKKELLFQYGSEEGTLGSIWFPSRNSWFNMVPKNEPLVQYGSEEEIPVHYGPERHS
jgi:hypothetical protein